MTPRLTLLLMAALSAAACAPRRQTASVPPAIPAPPPAAAPAPASVQVFEATAYSLEGRTASGARTREGIVAADPTILPLGTRIRVFDAGEYSGDYVVKDTGAKVKGREIDIYLANDAEAKRFGRRKVKVQVLE